MIYSLCFSPISNRTVTKLLGNNHRYNVSFSSMSNRTVTKPCTLKVNLPLSFSTMSNRTVTKLDMDQLPTFLPWLPVRLSGIYKVIHNYLEGS